MLLCCCAIVQLCACVVVQSCGCAVVWLLHEIASNSPPLLSLPSTFGHNLAAAAILATAVHYEITRSATPVNNGSKPKTTRFKLGSDLELPQCIVNEKFSLKI